MAFIRVTIMRRLLPNFLNIDCPRVSQQLLYLFNFFDWFSQFKSFFHVQLLIQYVPFKPLICYFKRL
ncbi:hypothetical protein Nizo2753_2891 [Lactiplantibacillus plantarum]|nr:hypothetical protein Nizo2753_2891 [Lactiplantibacillus plantarum]